MGLEKSSSAVSIYFSPSDNEENTARCTGPIRKNHLRQRKSGYDSMCFSLFPLRSFSLFLRATFFCSIWTIQSDSSNWLIMTWRKAIVRLIQSNATCGRQRGLSADVLTIYLNIMSLHSLSCLKQPRRNYDGWRRAWNSARPNSVFFSTNVVKSTSTQKYSVQLIIVRSTRTLLSPFSLFFGGGFVLRQLFQVGLHVKRKNLKKKRPNSNYST